MISINTLYYAHNLKSFKLTSFIHYYSTLCKHYERLVSTIGLAIYPRELLFYKYTPVKFFLFLTYK
jgi:hypothetical protein